MEKDKIEEQAPVILRLSPLFSIEAKPRILLFYFAIFVQLLGLAAGTLALDFGLQGFWLASTIIYLLWFILMFAILHPETDKLLNNASGRLKSCALVIIVIMILSGLVEIAAFTAFNTGASDGGGGFGRLIDTFRDGFKYNDSTALCQQATENLLQGRNPYAYSNVVEALIQNGSSFDRLTPLRLGELADVFPYPGEDRLEQLWGDAVLDTTQVPPEFDTVMCYPAGSFLLQTPFVAAGIKDIRIVYLVFVIAGLAYATFQIPKGKRLIFIIAALISLDLWNSIANGEMAGLVFPFLLIAWVTLGRKNWLSAAMMGLAIATKQIAWFFLPFYLVLLWRTSGLKAASAATGVIGLVFFALNAYFIFADPGLWFESVIYPMTEPAFPQGVGIITLVTSGLIDVQWQLPFAILEIAVFVAAILWYIRHARRFPEAGLILAVLPLFFAWRSLSSYFLYVVLIMLAGILCRAGQEKKNNQCSC